ncbi:MAG: hypothetical protein JXQ91_11810 [Vannielia sp.]|uniref:hypothetical protein n=1 Tax=Vannielia sp. TaxID=2813045 RepID=UPI003B8CBE86
MTEKIRNILRDLERLDASEKQEVFDRLKGTCISHPLEREWGTSAEVILDAIAQSTDLTQRGVKGVIADRAFHRLVVPQLEQSRWVSDPIEGDMPFDADLTRDGARTTVQVKMQRRTRGEPLERLASGEAHWVVEVQRTRSGQSSDGTSTRPYAFGSFDILAVNLYASSGDWSHFVYTVANWLLPRPKEPDLIAVMQPVSQKPSEFWTRDFDEAVAWLRSGDMRRLPEFERARRKPNARQARLL